MARSVGRAVRCRRELDHFDLAVGILDDSNEQKVSLVEKKHILAHRIRMVS